MYYYYHYCIRRVRNLWGASSEAWFIPCCVAQAITTPNLSCLPQCQQCSVHLPCWWRPCRRGMSVRRYSISCLKMLLPILAGSIPFNSPIPIHSPQSWGPWQDLPAHLLFRCSSSCVSLTSASPGQWASSCLRCSLRWRPLSRGSWHLVRQRQRQKMTW